jgi:PRTRC genetic system ThiF family protein
MHLIKSFLSNPLSPIYIDLIGVGGTGSYVLQGLAKLNLVHKEVVMNSQGIKVNVFDPDVISSSNTVRQLFREEEIGESKAMTIVGNINRNYGFSWNAFEEKYDVRKIKDTQVIILCPDNMEVRRKVYDYVAHKIKGQEINHGEGVYIIDFGNSYDYGQVYVSYVPGKNVKKDIPQYGFPKGYLETKEDLNEPSCSIAEAISKQKLFMNPLLANHGLNLLDELLTKEQMIYHGVYVSLETLASKSINWNG